MAESTAKQIQTAGSQELQRAEALLERDNLQEAIGTLEAISDSSADKAEVAELLGAAYFRLEQYDKAAEELKKAVAAKPGDAELRALCDLAVANDLADVQRRVPAPSYL